MSVAFRIRTSAGQELSFASHEMFEDFVRSGDLSPDDLVYDVETSSWSPARTHPIVLEIEYEREAEANEEGEATEAGEVTPTESRDGADEMGEAADGDGADELSEAADGDGADDAAADSTFGLSLAPPREPEPGQDDEATQGTSESGAGPETAESKEADAGADGAGGFGLELAPADVISSEEAAKAFVEKMDAERASKIDFEPGPASGLAFSMEGSGSLAEMISAPVVPEPPPAPPSRNTVTRDGARSEPAPSPRPSGGGARKVFAAVVVVALVGVGGYFGLQLLADDSAAEEAEGEAAVVPIAVAPVDPEPPPPEPVIANTESAVRERAQERFLTTTQNLLRDLEPIRDEWGTGAYLALPSAYADVVPIWQAYLTTIRGLRAADAARYEAAYEEALDDAAIVGEARAQRLEAALADFDAAAEARNGHYDRVEAIATAAIQSHNALIEAEGLILFDGSAGGGESGGIGAGASGRDADAQLLLDQVLELINATLDADGLGPGTGRNVRQWVWDGLLDAVTG
jgi:hypothetical protein